MPPATPNPTPAPAWMPPLALAASLLGAPDLPAQAVAPPAPTPGDVESTLPAPIRPAPAPAPAPELSAPASPAVPEGGPEIVVREFRVSGNTAIATAELQAALAGYRDRPITLLDVYRAAERLTALYRERGYAVASATVPAQEVTGGVVRLEIVEGAVSRMLFEGNARYSDAFLRGQLDEIAPGAPLRMDPLEREMQLLNDLPGLAARAVVKPGETFGSSELVIRSEERLWGGAVRVDNHGRESIGRTRFTADLFANSPTGRGDRLGITLLASQGGLLAYGRAEYSLPVGSKGTRVEASYSRFEFDTDEARLGLPPAVQIDGEGRNLRAAVTHPWLRGRRRNVRLAAALGHDESDESTALLGAPQTITSDKFVNLLEVEASGDLAHRDGAYTEGGLLLTSNLRSNRRSVLGNNRQLGKLDLRVSHLRPLAGPWSVVVRGVGALTLDPLMDIERFRIGGPGDVRGFQGAELSGDMGFAATLQVDRALRFADGVAAAVRAFWDGGIVYRMSDTRALTGEKARESLTSVGVGLSVRYADTFSLALDAALPTNARPASDGRRNGRLWALLAARF